MELTVVVGDDLNWLGVSVFAGAGYLCGSLLRNVGVLKIIALIFIVPFFFDLLVQLNNIWDATLPFLIFAGVGFIGPQRVWRFVTLLMTEGKFHLGYFIRRWK